MNFKKQLRDNLFIKIHKVMLLSLSLCFCSIVYGQTQQVTVRGNNQPLLNVFQQIEKQTNLSIAYNQTKLDVNKKVKENYINKELSFVLTDLLKNTGFSFRFEQKHIIIIPAKQENSATNAPSQQKNKEVIGRIVDESGEPVIGASVIETGTSNGCITDLDGRFMLKVNADKSTLDISYIGYQTQSVTTGTGKSLNVVLKEDAQTLAEVVVVGFGSQKKANLTGSVSSIKMDEVIGERPILKAADALQGTVPGLMVSSGGNDPGKSKSFQIRGAYSVGIKNSDGTYGNKIAPLVLIDNVEGDIDMLNPEDIETVTVLKDAASAAIYGARAAGGVILFTTKRPQSSTKFQLNYNNNFGVGKAVNLPKQAPLREYLQAYSDAAGDQYWTQGGSVSKWMRYLEEYKQDPSKFKTYGDGIFKDTDGAVYWLNEKDLIDNMLTNSFQMTHNISTSGGTDKLRYRLSGGYVSSDGVLITNKDTYDRFNVNAFISADITNWFTQEATMSYASSKKMVPSSALGAIYSTRLASFYPEGNMPGEISEKGKDLPFFTPRNQILWANPSKDLNDNPRIFLKSIVKPFKGFEAAFEYTFDKNVYDYHWYSGKTDYTTIEGGKDTTPTGLSA